MDIKTKEALLAVMKMSLDLHSRIMQIELANQTQGLQTPDEMTAKINELSKNFITAFDELMGILRRD